MAEWLPGHVQRMLALPGFVEAQRFEGADEEDGRQIFTVQYVMRDQEALDTYLLEHADPMRREGRELFGDDLDASRSVHTLAGKQTASCLNCSAALDGQYCWNCGQRNRERVITLGELLRDGFSELFDFDSRFWRTVKPLLLKPGYLTAEYLRGRRVAYMPPFRTYLILSFIFFLAFQFSDELNAELEVAEVEAADTQEPPTISDEAAPAAIEDATDADEEAIQAGIRIGASEDGRCEINLDFGIPVLQRLMPPEHQTAVCEDLKATRGAKLFNRLEQLAPIAALFLLPIMALLLSMLYPLSRRYYVEHLLFLIHFHAFAFLGWILIRAYELGVSALEPHPAVIAIPATIGGLYIWLYLYRAMRRVYQQRHLATIPKFLILNAGYLAAFIFVLLCVLIYIVITY